MTVLATMRNENFDVSRIEIDRPGLTYTIDTIEQLKQYCRKDVRLYFITGADAIRTELCIGKIRNVCCHYVILWQ